MEIDNCNIQNIAHLFDGGLYQQHRARSKAEDKCQRKRYKITQKQSDSWKKLENKWYNSKCMSCNFRMPNSKHNEYYKMKKYKETNICNKCHFHQQYTEHSDDDLDLDTDDEDEEDYMYILNRLSLADQPTKKPKV